MSKTWKFEVLPEDKHNLRLLGHVHPADWTNPDPDGPYNLIVIGAGSAGLIAATETVKQGGKVALIERHLMGGDCLNVGCVPSKSIIRPARLAHEMRRAETFGLTPAEISGSDFPKVMDRMRQLRADFSRHDAPEGFAETGMDVFLGEARFSGKNTVEVDGKTLIFKKALISTGARPRIPDDVDGLEEAGYRTNETIFNLTALPDHLVVIGGGPIGCELAQAFARLGSEVTIVLRSSFLSKEDPEAAALLGEIFAAEGIHILTDAKVARVSLADGRKHVHIVRNGGALTVEADELLVGAGRIPNVEGMDLEKAGVEYDLKSGILVNDHLRTSNRLVYAAGDCCMKHKFTHAADAAARIVVQNTLFGRRKRLSDLVVPWCTYTDPEIAHVGLYEDEAESKGIKTAVFRAELSNNGRAEMDGEDDGFVKIIMEKGSDRILGATVVAAHAGDLICEITTVMTAGLGLDAIARTIHPYPTQAEAIKAAADDWQKSRCTASYARTLAKKWLKLMRT